MTPEEQADLDAWVRAMTQLFSASFESAARYSNIFIITGYGSFFGLWNLTRDRLAGSRVALWAVLFMLLSVATYIGHQVFNVYSNASGLMRLNKALLEHPPTSLREFMKRYEEYGAEEKRGAPMLLKVWRPAFFVAVVAGFIGIGVLAWALIEAVRSCQVPYACS